ncbi:MAG: ribonuclease P protein component [Opitutaceae bacterium]|nr:ribonuclease P protein component [Opitutaceae bacterium]
MRFRPEQHLRLQNDFRAVREHGRRVDCGAFTLWWHRRAPHAGVARSLPAPAITVARVGVVASIAAVGAAVQRNRAKRRLRAVFRHQQKLVPVDCDLLLVARAAVIHLPYTEVERKFIEACRRLTPPKDV